MRMHFLRSTFFVQRVFRCRRPWLTCIGRGGLRVLWYTEWVRRFSIFRTHRSFPPVTPVRVETYAFYAFSIPAVQKRAPSGVVRTFVRLPPPNPLNATSDRASLSTPGSPPLPDRPERIRGTNSHVA